MTIARWLTRVLFALRLHPGHHASISYDLQERVSVTVLLFFQDSVFAGVNAHGRAWLARKQIPYRVWSKKPAVIAFPFREDAERWSAMQEEFAIEYQTESPTIAGNVREWLDDNSVLYMESEKYSRFCFRLMDPDDGIMFTLAHNIKPSKYSRNAFTVTSV